MSAPKRKAAGGYHTTTTAIRNATIAFDSTTVRIITEAVGKIRGALATSQVVWLPGQEQIQAHLPAARNDLSFQGFLKTLSDSTEQRTATTDNAPAALR